MNTLEQLLYRDSLAASLSDSSKATAFVFLNSLATSNLNIDIHKRLFAGYLSI